MEMRDGRGVGVGGEGRGEGKMAGANWVGTKGGCWRGNGASVCLVV